MKQLKDIISVIGGRLYHPERSDTRAAEQMRLSRLAPIDRAKPGEMTFLTNPEYEAYLASCQASVIIVSKEYPQVKQWQLVHDLPYWAFAKSGQLFLEAMQAHRAKSAASISEQAVIAKTAVIGDGVTVEPFAVIRDHVRIGDGVFIGSGVSIGEGSTIGAKSYLYPRSVVYHNCLIGESVIIHAGAVVGADGFGFAPAPSKNDIAKIPQVGRVVIEDDVEIGANSTIDRGALGDTLIKRGCKLDSHVHVGHNVVVGEHSMLCGMAAIAGSAQIGSWCVVAGHSGLNNRVKVVDGTQIGAMTGVTKDITEAGTYLGFPAQEAGKWRRQQVYLRRLADLEKRLRDLEKCK